MKTYEIICIVRPDLAESAIEEKIVSKFKQITERYHGEILKTETWGLRKLAYNINKFEDGYYIFNLVKGEPVLISELERNFQIDENILRFMTIKLKEKSAKKTTAEPEIPKEEKI